MVERADCARKKGSVGQMSTLRESRIIYTLVSLDLSNSIRSRRENFLQAFSSEVVIIVVVVVAIFFSFVENETGMSGAS
jgi:hypothetical protein